MALAFPEKPTLRRILSISLECLAVFLAVATLIGVGIVLNKDHGILVKAIGGLASGLSGSLAAYLHRQARILVVVSADEVQQTDKRRPVFYLRSFRDDEKTATTVATDVPGLQTLSSEQEHLETALRRIGPVIGAAALDSTQLGFGPVKMSHHEWRENVIELMKQAQLVVLRIANTEGVLWEFGNAVKFVAPQRLLFLVPAHKDYDSFKILSGKLFPLELPDYKRPRRAPRATLTGIVYFTSNSQPRFAPLEIPKWRGETLTAALIHAMKPVYDELGLPWKPAPFSTLKIAMALYAASLIAFFLYAVVSGDKASNRQGPGSEVCSMIKSGRSSLKNGLSLQQRDRCCVKQPWLMGC
jgi:hypothetical protein